jgi:hypothetical protein
MTQKRSNPAVGADRARKCIAVSANAPEHKSQTPDLQQLRAYWLTSRLRIGRDLAATIAPMIFGEGARR